MQRRRVDRRVVWNAAYYGIGVDMIATGASSSCTAINSSTNPTSVTQGSPETITTTISNCAPVPRLMKVVTKTSPPGGCGTATTARTNVPLQPRVQTTLSSVFTAPTCTGTYKVTTTMSVGTTVVGRSTVTYQVS